MAEIRCNYCRHQVTGSPGEPHLHFSDQNCRSQEISITAGRLVKTSPRQCTAIIGQAAVWRPKVRVFGTMTEDEVVLSNPIPQPATIEVEAWGPWGPEREELVRAWAQTVGIPDDVPIEVKQREGDDSTDFWNRKVFPVTYDSPARVVIEDNLMSLF